MPMRMRFAFSCSRELLKLKEATQKLCMHKSLKIFGCLHLPENDDFSGELYKGRPQTQQLSKTERIKMHKSQLLRTSILFSR